jgi:prepilin-type N-terminal cleavage/methylation domain-containing protein
MDLKKGFTLLEMVITVAIILVLVLLLLLVLNPQGSINRAYDSHRKQDLKNLSIAFESYYSDYACYPVQDQINNCQSDDLDPYIKEIPCDPSTNVPYELLGDDEICSIDFILYTQLKKSNDDDESIDSFGCFSVSSSDTVLDPEHDCTVYYDAYGPTYTPTESEPTESGPTEEPTPPTYYYYCSNLNNCTQLPDGKSCEPNFPWPDVSCSGACGDPANICTPE